MYDHAGNMYISDEINSCVRVVAPDGIIYTFAGTCTVGGYSGDGGPAVSARMNSPYQTAYSKGNMYIADTNNNAIRVVSMQSGIISTFVGSSTGGGGLVDGEGTNAYFNNPYGLIADHVGNLYVGDRNNNAVRMVTPEGVVSTIAGHTGGQGTSADGSAAYTALLSWPHGLALDASGNLYIANWVGNTISVVYRR